MQPRSKGALWSNDAAAPAAAAAVASHAGAPGSKGAAGKRGKKRGLPDADAGSEPEDADASDDEYQQLPTAKRRAGAFLQTSKSGLQAVARGGDG